MCLQRLFQGCSCSVVYTSIRAGLQNLLLKYVFVNNCACFVSQLMRSKYNNEPVNSFSAINICLAFFQAMVLATDINSLYLLTVFISMKYPALDPIMFLYYKKTLLFSTLFWCILNTTSYIPIFQPSPIFTFNLFLENYVSIGVQGRQLSD